MSGASNVTGFVQPIHRLARKAHAVGASILVDAAQLAPHRRIDIRPDDDPEHLDFVALSAHKMYAPFGTGALVGRRDIFLQGAPEYQGGGTVEIVTPDEVHWAGLPDREEAGSPNVVGAVAMAAAARALMDAGMESVERHEASLTTYALERLQSLPGITIYGATRSASGARSGRGHSLQSRDRSITHWSRHPGLRREALASAAAASVRSRTSRTCLGAPSQRLAAGCSAQPADETLPRPGMVRISLGAYNTSEDVDVLVEMLERIMRNDYRSQDRLRAGKLGL